jgi:hypothetical protein
LGRKEKEKEKKIKNREKFEGEQEELNSICFILFFILKNFFRFITTK